ncbi:MAG TPA: class I tRNA ligase family protein, partial [Verrucomicrobiae bacterium]
RWILGEFAKLEAEVLAAYDQYEFHVVYQKLSQFIAVELSSVYHDVIKDRLYTDAANSPRRRSTQTALHRLVTGLCQMLAPILAFTADEAWEFVPGKNVNSVHESEFKPGNFSISEIEKENWQSLLELRGSVQLELEQSRQAKVIGKALEAKVSISNKAKTHGEIAAKMPNDFRELINVSQIEFRSENVWPVCIVEKADGQKCERCWHWETDIGQNAEHPTLCGRCVEAVMQFKA